MIFPFSPQATHDRSLLGPLKTQPKMQPAFRKIETSHQKLGKVKKNGNLSDVSENLTFSIFTTAGPRSQPVGASSENISETQCIFRKRDKTTIHNSNNTEGSILEHKMKSRGKNNETIITMGGGRRPPPHPYYHFTIFGPGFHSRLGDLPLCIVAVVSCCLSFWAFWGIC